jgi:hypothetical protein
MKKIFKRIFRITVLAFLTAILTIATIVLFPQYLFAHKIEYKNFRVYSNGKIDDNIKTVLDNALTLVKRSEMNDSNYKYNIILCYKSFYNLIDEKLLGVGRTARATLNNVIIKVRIDPANNLAFPTFHKSCEVDLTELLAHEMTHCLQANKYGIMKFNPYRHPEFWKLEGYPEYISKQKEISNENYSLASDIARYVSNLSKANGVWILEDEGGCEVPDYYYRERLMIEYLMDARHFSYDKILHDTVSENTVYQKMIKWSQTKVEYKNSTSRALTVTGKP